MAQVRKTQKEKIADALRRAYLSEVPVVYLITDENELVADVMYSGKIVPLVKSVQLPDPDKKVSPCVTQYTEIVPLESRSSQKRFDYYLRSHICNVRFDAMDIFDSSLANAGIAQLSVYLNRMPPLQEVNAAIEVKPENTPLNKTLVTYLNLRLSILNTITKNISADLSLGIRKTMVIIVSPKPVIPDEIAPYTEVITVEPLQEWEIESMLRDYAKENSEEIHKEAINEMLIRMKGFSEYKIHEILAKIRAEAGCLFYNSSFDPKRTKAEHYEFVNQLIFNEKLRHLNKNGIFKFFTPKEIKAAGLDALSKWIGDKSGIFSDVEKARRQAIAPPRGVVVAGIPGTGKSLMAKYTAAMLKLPLVQMDLSGLLGGMVGDSEHNMEKALHQAEAMAPCVLWIDEIEKVFAGSKESRSDGGVVKRLFGLFLIWMQEKQASCFVFATSNDVTTLPSELFRSGRFDMRFYTFLPSKKECIAIFTGIVAKQNKDYQELLKELAESDPQTIRSMPEALFDPALSESTFYDHILDFCVTFRRKEEGMISTQATDENTRLVAECHDKSAKERIPIPARKLLTGADIEDLIEKAKNGIFKKHNYQAATGAYVYDEQTFRKELENAILVCSPYGETNLRNIVKCFLKLHENKFTPAASLPIVDFAHYREDLCRYEDSRSLDNDYDRVLRATLTAAIHNYAPEIVEEIKAEKRQNG